MTRLLRTWNNEGQWLNEVPKARSLGRSTQRKNVEFKWTKICDRASNKVQCWLMDLDTGFR